MLENLRELRLNKKMSQYELALRAGLSQAHVSVLERGLVRMNERCRARLALALEITDDVNNAEPEPEQGK